jgi:hypothetical protein
LPRQRAVGRFFGGRKKISAPYLNQSAAKLNTALSRLFATTCKKSCPFYHVSQVVAAQRLEKNKFSTRQRARIVCTAHALPRAHTCTCVYVCAAPLRLSYGVRRRKNAAGAKRTVGRKRPRRRGQNRAACVATAVLTRKCDDRSKRKPRDSRAVKIEIDPLYAELRARLQAYRRVQKSMTLRNGLLHGWCAVSTVEKHERSFRLFAGVRGLAPRFADVARTLIDSARGPTSLRKVNQTPAPSAAIHRRSTSLSQMSGIRLHNRQFRESDEIGT